MVTMSAKTKAELRDKEERVAQNRAGLLGVQYTDVRNQDALTFLPDVLSVEDMERLKVVPVTGGVAQIVFGFTLSTPQTSLDELRQKLPQYNLAYTFISETGFDEVFATYYQHAHKDEPKPPSPDEVANQLADKILEVNQELGRGEDINLFDQEFSQTAQADLFKFLAQQAFLLDASDIHIEPEADGAARIRFRIDGRLHIVGHLEKQRYNVLLNDLQMRARIRWNADYPQTGSTKETLINQNKESLEVNMRVETVPTIHGSDIVVRIFNMDQSFLNIDNLGLKPHQRQPIDQLVSQPHGLVLMVGPTGSGKSSTQYAIINELNTPQVKIVTLEDPVEYDIKGVTQIPVDTDNDDQDTFMDKLRAVIREDPDIIMIGEIRDQETARTALQASLTGHLVLSTFHASTGAAAISRMLDMIDYNPLLASAFRLIMSQRLVRRLCEHCKQAYTPDEDTAAAIAQALQGSSEQHEEITLYKPIGCEECHHIGYQGRLLIVEQFQMTERISSEISGDHTISVRRLQELAVAGGMETMFQDGIHKALAGLTSIEEVLRVVELR